MKKITYQYDLDSFFMLANFSIIDEQLESSQKK